MKAHHFIRNTFLTGLCVGLLVGCSWLEDWPPKDSEMARKAAPKPPASESKVMKQGDGTWLQADNGEPVQMNAAEPKGLAVDPASSDRIAALEQELANIRNDLKLMMPSLTKLAEAQGDMQRMLGGVEPAAGSADRHDQRANQAGASAPMPLHAPQATAQTAAPMPNAAATGNPQPGTVAWYEQQERLNRQRMAANTPPAMPPPAHYQPVQQQMAQAAPVPVPAHMGHSQMGQPMMAQQANQPPPAQPVYQPPVPQAASAPVSAPPPAQFQPASHGSAMGGAAVTGLRFGEHSDKTRLVFDTSDNVAFSYDLDNNERILMINLPGTGWMGSQQMQISGSPMVQSYNVVPDNAGGHQAVIQLRQRARVLWAQALRPGGPQGHRIVLDLAPM